MSYCVSYGKDKVMFLTEEDLKGPSSIVLPEIDEPRGFLLPNGEINWACPCLGNAAIGPCSVEFRESLTCFHKSTADPKGSDCLGEFREMNDCMSKYPALYRRNEDADAALKSLEKEQSQVDFEDDDEEASSGNLEKNEEETSSRGLEKNDESAGTKTNSSKQ